MDKKQSIELLYQLSRVANVSAEMHEKALQAAQTLLKDETTETKGKTDTGVRGK